VTLGVLSELETPLNRPYQELVGVPLVVERTQQRLGHLEIPLEERSGIILKGKREPMSLYAPRLPAAALSS
jgi:hypothetical protein